MKYEINHTCGHTETVQIYGTNVHGERERKAAWMESRPCKECARKAELDAAEAWEAEVGLTADMTGTEKQVAWARRLRHQALAEALAHLSPDRTDQFIAWADGLSASFWIDNQDRSYMAYINAYADTLR